MAARRGRDLPNAEVIAYVSGRLLETPQGTCGARMIAGGAKFSVTGH